MMLKNQQINADDDLQEMRREAMDSLKRIYEVETEEERRKRHRRFIESLCIPLEDAQASD
jgi:hypothetical protein